MVLWNIDTKERILFIFTSLNTGVIAPMYMHMLNMHDIILIVDDIIMLLS